MKPELTIGIALFNGEKFISKNLDSILNQSFTNFEILISDANSTDKSRMICEDYCKIDHRIKYIKQSKQFDEKSNKLFLIQNAVGKYFKHVDQDDYLNEPFYLESLINKIRKGYDFVISDVKIKELKGSKTFTFDSATNKAFKNCKNNFEFVKGSFRESAFIIYGMFERENFLSYYSSFQKEYVNSKHFIDGVLVHKIATELKGSYIENCSFTYLIHGNNISRSAPIKELFKDYNIYLWDTFKYILWTKYLNLNQKVILIVFQMKNLIYSFYYLMHIIFKRDKK